jgi:hypothetical protein
MQYTINAPTIATPTNADDPATTTVSVDKPSSKLFEVSAPSNAGADKLGDTVAERVRERDSDTLAIGVTVLEVVLLGDSLAVHVVDVVELEVVVMEGVTVVVAVAVTERVTARCLTACAGPMLPFRQPSSLAVVAVSTSASASASAEGRMAECRFQVGSR